MNGMRCGCISSVAVCEEGKRLQAELKRTYDLHTRQRVLEGIALEERRLHAAGGPVTWKAPSHESTQAELNWRAACNVWETHVQHYDREKDRAMLQAKEQRKQLLNDIRALREWVEQWKDRMFEVSEASQDVKRSQRYNAYSTAFWRVGTVLDDVLRDCSGMHPLVYADRQMEVVVGEMLVADWRNNVDCSGCALRVYKVVYRKLCRLATVYPSFF